MSDDENDQLLNEKGGNNAASIPAQIVTPNMRTSVVNVVATADLSVRNLDVKDIAMRARNAEYNPKKFSAVILRIRDPKATALVFTTGKIVVTGSKSEDEAKNAMKRFAKQLSKINTSIKPKNFVIQNVVCNADVGFPIRLEGMATAHTRYATYEPELFPGLIYRMTSPPGMVVLVFVSGKIVVTGAKSKATIEEALNFLYPVLRDYRKS